MAYSPLRYPGGKGQMYDFVVEILENNDLLGSTYIEPFCGGAGVALRLLFDEKVERIIINDYDPSIYAFWKSIIEYNDEFIELVENIDINMENWYIQKEIQKRKEDYNVAIVTDLLELGFSTFFLNRTNRSGIIKAGVIGGKNQNGNYLMDCRFNKGKLISLISKIGSYSDRIEIYNLDAVEFICSKRGEVENAFYFIDPPYYVKGKDLYTNALGHDDHVRIENTITKTLHQEKWIVTYDICEEIKQIYYKYRPREKELRYSLAKKVKKNEFLFANNIKFKDINDNK